MLTHFFLSRTHDLHRFHKLLRKLVKAKLLRRDTAAIMENALQLETLQVRDVMIPRAKMVLMEEDDDFNKILSVITARPHSRFPVINKQKDKIMGILLAKDLLNLVGTDAVNKTADQDIASFRLEQIVRPALFVPESKKLMKLLNDFKKNHSHMAIVLDEYGGTAGLVTIEDVLEQVVGDIIDESDPDAHQQYIDFRRHHGKQKIYQIDALMPLEDFNETFGTAIDDENFDTIGGIVIHALGYVPKKGESTTIDHLVFQVIDADKRRIKKLQITTPR